MSQNNKFMVFLGHLLLGVFGLIVTISVILTLMEFVDFIF